MSETPSSSPNARTSRQRRVLVSGGGADGLAASLALHADGHDVTLTPATGPTRAGVDATVVDGALARFLDRHDLNEVDGLTTGARQYRYLDADGGLEAAADVDHHVTASDTLERALRHVLPDDVETRHEIDHREFAPLPDRPLGVGPAADEARAVEGPQEDGDVPWAATGHDLHVAADGWLSDARQHLYPEVTPDYAGYVAWQGAVSTTEVPDDLVARFDDAVTVSRGSRDLLVALLLPGASPGGGRDDRRLAWVWYTPVAPRELGTVLTDRHGTNHEQAVPRGALQDRFTTGLHERAAEHAPALTRLVRATPDPGVEPVVDLAVPRSVVGRTALLGNAAFTTRHHTAAGTTKAFSDATVLADALDRYDDVDHALADWEHTQGQRGRQLVEQGRQMDLDRLIGEV